MALFNRIRQPARTIGATGICALALAALAAPVSAQEKLTVRLDWSTHAMHAPFFVAKEKGWFKAAGLDVSIEDGNGSTTTVQLIGSGQFDVGHASLAPMAMAKAKGLPVISVAGFLRKGDMGILVPAESDMHKPADLAGKKVVYTAGSLEGPFVGPFFRNNGTPPDRINLLNVEAAAKVGTYLSGNADAAISTVPFFLPITDAKRPSRGILFADYGMNLPGFGLVVNTRTLREKGESIKKFASIVSGTWTYILNGNEDEAVKAILANRPQSPLSAEILRKQIDSNRPFFWTEATRNMPIGLQSDADWTDTIKQMEEADVLKKGSKPQDYFTNDYIDAALFTRVSGIR